MYMKNDIPVKNEFAMSPHGFKLKVPLAANSPQEADNVLSAFPIFYVEMQCRD
jgi:hypothetical protein